MELAWEDSPAKKAAERSSTMQSAVTTNAGTWAHSDDEEKCSENEEKRSDGPESGVISPCPIRSPVKLARDPRTGMISILKEKVYTHTDGSRETVRIMKEHSNAEGGGVTIFIPSLGRERQTTKARLTTEWLQSEDEETDDDASDRELELSTVVEVPSSLPISFDDFYSIEPTNTATADVNEDEDTQIVSDADRSSIDIRPKTMDAPYSPFGKTDYSAVLDSEGTEDSEGEGEEDEQWSVATKSPHDQNRNSANSAGEQNSGGLLSSCVSFGSVCGGIIPEPASTIDALNCVRIKNGSANRYSDALPVAGAGKNVVVDESGPCCVVPAPGPE